MAGYEIKTKITDTKVEDFLASVADERQRDDAHRIIDMMHRLTGQPPKMWGPSIIGFGQYHYKYDSGHEGDMARMGFSPRKANTVIYLKENFSDDSETMAKLGKHKTGKVCLYIKRLSDIDESVLEELCAETLRHMDERYPE